MGKKKAYFVKLDHDWMHDEKVIDYKAAYGHGALIDVVNSFVLMSKCGGVVDLNRPAHVEWANYYMGKSGKALLTAFERLAAFGIIDAEVYRTLNHVTSNRAAKDAADIAEAAERRSRQTSAARAAKAAKRSVTGSVTEPVTEPVTRP